MEATGELTEVLLAQSLGDRKAQCNMCQWRCKIREGGAGHCRTVMNRHGVLFSTIYGLVSSAAADPIEKKPVFHFAPGSLCFSVGSLGCNFRCIFCQNWQIAYSDAVDSPSDAGANYLSPQNLVAMAKRHGCQGVAWTYNEPAIWLNYTLDCARLCKQDGLYTVYVTNGYSTPEALDLIGPYLDVYRVDIKSTEDAYYKELIKIPHWRGILDVAVRAKRKWEMHVECVTNVIPGWNDSERNLLDTAAWIADQLGPDTPWHVTKFFPHSSLRDVPCTPESTLQRAVAIGRQAGLRFVYLGNVGTDTGLNTYCPKCGSLAVRRAGYQAEPVGIDDAGRCAVDGESLNIRVL